MKGVHTSIQIKQEPTHTSHIFSDVLISCSQILVGNEKWAIRCQSDLEPDEGWTICTDLMDYKIASLDETFSWCSTRLAALIDREAYEQAEIERGVDLTGPRLDAFEQCDRFRDKMLTGAMKKRGLVIVDHNNAACIRDFCSFYKYWRSVSERPDIQSKICQLLGHSEEYRRNTGLTWSEIFVDYQLLFLRQKRN
eukprot:Gregarina_sp_Poly_1__3572@NODE_2045_length_2780_cov_14_417250_g1319_i0_p1_GENE_NODE_2045_length_2780_cov_14_417250_g1319_i0NODE_2045_length_2780_cov_14_417250_g1319_i0_p1_ORF_typecomplete_len195_score18_58DUF2185/PF09951_9/0_042_NODE_2045_length_2780_cov_14_417250_g1319_i061645